MANNRYITVHEFCNATNTEDLSIEFARQHNLILAADNIWQQHQRNGFCLMGTPNFNVSQDGKSHTKDSLKAALTIIYLWANKLSILQSKNLIGDLVIDDHTYIDWGNFVRGMESHDFDQNFIIDPGEA
uniref:Uncharacterized protein n=1 Tax=Romanomermis culicivorax TaxID=13658 RepID=A0A915KZL2_ROMCU